MIILLEITLLSKAESVKISTDSLYFIFLHLQIKRAITYDKPQYYNALSCYAYQVIWEDGDF